MILSNPSVNATISDSTGVVTILDDEYCGDGIVQPEYNEQCEPNQTGCNASCMFDTSIVCHGLIINPNPVYVTQSVTITASGTVWASGGLYL